MEQKNETFTYTYSAAQQEEIQAIRKKYLAEAEPTRLDKMEQLRQLDSGVTKKGTTVALTLGILGTLVMGSGMSMIMTDLGELLGLSWPLIPGILIGVVGMVGVIAAYPLYHHITKKERARIAPQILKLADELSQQ